MPTTNLNITTVATSQNNKTTTINDALEKLDTATQGVLEVAITAAQTTLTNTQFRSFFMFKFTGTFVGNYEVNISTNASRSFAVHNALGGDLTLDLGAGASLIVPPHLPSEYSICHRDSSGVTRVVAGVGSGGGGGGSFLQDKTDLNITAGNIPVLTTSAVFTSNLAFNIVGNASGADRQINFPTASPKILIIRNTTTSNLEIRVGASSYLVPALQNRVLYTDGTLIYSLEKLESNIVRTDTTDFTITDDDFNRFNFYDLTGVTESDQIMTIPTGIAKTFVVITSANTSVGGWRLRVGPGGPTRLGIGTTTQFYSDGTSLFEISSKQSNMVISGATTNLFLDAGVLKGYSAIRLDGVPTSTQFLSLPGGIGIAKYFTVINNNPSNNWAVKSSSSSFTVDVKPLEAVTFYFDGDNITAISAGEKINKLNSAIIGATTITEAQTEANCVFTSSGSPASAYTKQLAATDNPKLIAIQNTSSQAETFSIATGTTNILLPPTASAIAYIEKTINNDLIQLTKMRDYALPITVTGNTIISIEQFRAYSVFILSGTPAPFQFITPTTQNIGTFSVVNTTTVNCTVRANGNIPTEFILRPGNIGTFFADGTVLRLLSVTAINNQAWIAFTPTIIGATTNPSVTYTIQTGRYRYSGGDKIEGFLRIVTAAYTAGTGDARIALTGLPNCNGTYRGRAILNDYAGVTGASIYKIGAVLPASAQIQLLTSSTSLIRIASNGLVTPITLEAEFEYSIT
jgi:hypothetical protein